ncbi:hypothetical protein FQN50_001406 [Emmonsiellopsis sp. PD_5]|nr:hypothetical protein FQN50_001406 [Emmonsiellopsis sp. PD_5]
MSPREPTPTGVNPDVDITINDAAITKFGVPESSAPDRPFDEILNFRDVGAHINRLCGSSIMKEGVLLRSARPDRASKRDQERLTKELRLATVIDFRSRTEHAMAANKHLTEQSSNAQTDREPTPPHPPSTTNDEHLLTLPGVRRILLSLAGWNLEKLLLWSKFLSLLASGYRHDATRLVIQQAMVPRGLTGLAHDTLTASQSEIKDLFTTLSLPQTYPVLVHCTQGKDRTGLAVILLLLLVNAATPAGATTNDDDEDIIPLAAITTDYRASEKELVPELEERVEEMRAMGLSEEFALCPGGFVREVVRWLEEGYGGVRGYLEVIGVEEEVVERVRGLLVA